MSVIEICHITKEYGYQKGVFDISFEINEGEVVGFLGPNGSGKTTTIRQLMGFVKPDQGKMTIFQKDCFKEAAAIQQYIGYLPGEIALMEDMTGMEFIYFVAHMKGIKDMHKVEELIQFLELDARGKIKKMSKGMKQKIGIIVALMGDPSLLILDEPTSGLDPLMQNKFIELIQKAKKAGKTIFISSHIFEEIENTCDRVVMIKDGRIVAIESMDCLKNNRYKHYEIGFEKQSEIKEFMNDYPQAVQDERVVFLTMKGDVNTLIRRLSHFHISYFYARPQSLEELFLHYYGGDHDDMDISQERNSIKL